MGKGRYAYFLKLHILLAFAKFCLSYQIVVSHTKYFGMRRLQLSTNLTSPASSAVMCKTCAQLQNKVSSVKKINVVVTSSFFFSGNFCFLWFLSIVMYANETETKEKEKLPKMKKLTTT